MDDFVIAQSAEIAVRAERELEALVAVSSPSGDVAGAEEAVAVCAALLPSTAEIERVDCSTAGSAQDLVARLRGIGHLDTVIEHRSHKPLRRDGARLYGPGTADMKGGVILSLGVARALATEPERFAELSVLLVTDEEWRLTPFVHTERFTHYDACLCFEAGQLAPDGQEAVIVRRKAAGTLRVLALARTAVSVAGRHDPAGPQRLSVVPTVVRSGRAFNVVPAEGELVFDLRSDDAAAFDAVRSAVAAELDDVALDANMERVWPAMDSRQSTRELLARAGERLGAPIIGAPRGGASDASHFAPHIPLTVDGLGPRGGGAHTPDEFVLASSLGPRAAVALALAVEALDGAVR
jgi:glutamate carboxypeptidase